jgi:hypothetical protein
MATQFLLNRHSGERLRIDGKYAENDAGHSCAGQQKGRHIPQPLRLGRRQGGAKISLVYSVSIMPPCIGRAAPKTIVANAGQRCGRAAIHPVRDGA